MPFRPFKPVTHLKPQDLSRGFDDRSPALCGEPDKGTFFFLSVANQGELDQLIAEDKGKPYPTCTGCAIEQERRFR